MVRHDLWYKLSHNHLNRHKDVSPSAQRQELNNVHISQRSLELRKVARPVIERYLIGRIEFSDFFHDKTNKVRGCYSQGINRPLVIRSDGEEHVRNVL
jgi:hypothetical protein